MSDNRIIDAICCSDSTFSVSLVVDSLLEAYQNGDQRLPLLSLVRTIATASGVTSVEIQPTDVEASVEVAAVLENLYRCVAVDSSAYFLVNKDPKYKKFPQLFDDLWKLVVRGAFAADLLFQENFLPALSQWLVAMTESKCRSFRHTSSIAVMSIIHALIELQEALKSRLSFVREANEMDEVKKNMDQVIQWRDHLFSQTVHQRLRDVAYDIRMATVQQLKSWIMKYPDEYMENKYLRYFGMPLHDKKPALRAEALSMILQCLGRVEGAYERMKLFIDYFLKRIVEMTNDVDTKCVELSLRVLAMVVKLSAENHAGEESLTSEMIDSALRCLFDERHSVRTAAGVLLTVFVYTRSTEEEEEGEQLKVAAELIGSFAGTLRKQYKEQMPEKYLVDALWSSGMPPAVLTDTQALTTELAMSSNTDEVLVGLGFISATLQKLQGVLSLGPTPKDERRTANVKLTAAKKERHDLFLVSLSSSAVGIVSKTLKKYTGNREALCACASIIAALDLSLITAGDQDELGEVLKELRRASQTASLDMSSVESLTSAWHSLANTEHALRSNSEGHVLQMKELIQKQVLTFGSGKGSPKKRSSEAPNLAARCFLLSSLSPFSDVWSSVEVAFNPFLNLSHTDSPEVTKCIAATMMNCVMWDWKASSGDEGIESNSILKDGAQKLVQLCFTTPEVSSTSEKENLSIVEIQVIVFVSVCDLECLKLCCFTDEEQEKLLHIFEAVFEKVSNLSRESLDAYRSAQNTKSETMDTLHARLHDARAEWYRWDCLQLRLVQGLGRLFLLQRIQLSLAPRLLFFWTQTTSRSISGFFKQLFHALRDGSGDGFSLERDTLAIAYNRCVEVGATPISIEAMYQLSTKLASLHFALATDRYYAACVSMVQHGIEFASTVDPLILQGIVPYCIKLKMPEALHFLRHELPSREIFKSLANPYVRSFVSALSRTAKVEDVTTGAAGKKRLREVNADAETTNTESALEELMDSMPVREETTPPSQRKTRRQGNKTQQPVEHSRVVDEDGWHVRADAMQASSQTSVPPSQTNEKSKKRGAPRRPAVNLPSTQETIATMDENTFEEMFILTEDIEDK